MNGYFYVVNGYLMSLYTGLAASDLVRLFDNSKLNVSVKTSRPFSRVSLESVEEFDDLLLNGSILGLGLTL